MKFEKIMNQIEKGNTGYIDERKKRYLLMAIVEFAVVFSVFFAGIITTKTRLNVMTVVAAVGCLPASKMLVEYLVMLPFQSLDRNLAEEIKAHASDLTCCFDLLVSHTDKLMCVDAIVITSDTVCGYAKDPKIDALKAEKHMKAVLAEEGYDPVSVRVLKDYKQYLKRVDMINKNVVEEHLQYKELEVDMKNCILTTCM